MSEDENARRALLHEKFSELFGGEPEIWARAPGRVDLMGSHTDYNLGYVMTMTIDRDTWVAARPRDDCRVAVHSLNLPGGGEFALNAITSDPESPWTDYVRGVALHMQEAGYPVKGMDALIHSTIPFGSGVSSSAAIEMATAVAFQLVGKFQLDPVEMALIGQRAENRFVGVNSGILDQYSSALGMAGTALLLDCRDLTSRTVPIDPNLEVVICDTRAPRMLTGTEYGTRRAQCEEGVRLLSQWYPDVTALRDLSIEQFAAYEQSLPPVVAKRCRFIIEENDRVLNLAKALPTGDQAWLGELCAASYAGARDLYEIGAPSMAAMMRAMLSAPGVVGARQAGAGFGGCMVALVRRGQTLAFTKQVTNAYAVATGIMPSVYIVHASPGAGAL